MNKLKPIFAVSTWLFLAVLSGCSEDESVPAVDPPSLNVVTTPSSTNGTIQIILDESVNFSIGVMADGGFNNLSLRATDEMGNLRLSIDTARAPGETVTSFDVVYEINFGNDPALVNSSVAVQISATDDLNQTSSEVFIVDIVSQGIEAYTAVLIGGFNNETLGSSYDAQADSVYFATNLRNNSANQSLIDFVYYFADVPQRTIASPDNAEAQITWDAQNMSSWPFDMVENSTRFKIPMSGVSFDDLNSSSDLEVLFGEVGTGDSRVTDLSVGNLVAFQLDDDRGSRYGAFVVDAVEGNSSGSITISVKVQSEDN
jgi:hypothetical protein